MKAANSILMITTVIFPTKYNCIRRLVRFAFLIIYHIYHLSRKNHINDLYGKMQVLAYAWIHLKTCA